MLAHKDIEGEGWKVVQHWARSRLGVEIVTDCVPVRHQQGLLWILMAAFCETWNCNRGLSAYTPYTLASWRWITGLWLRPEKCFGRSSSNFDSPVCATSRGRKKHTAKSISVASSVGNCCKLWPGARFCWRHTRIPRHQSRCGVVAHRAGQRDLSFHSLSVSKVFVFTCCCTFHPKSATKTTDPWIVFRSASRCSFLLRLDAPQSCQSCIYVMLGFTTSGR